MKLANGIKKRLPDNIKYREYTEGDKERLKQLQVPPPFAKLLIMFNMMIIISVVLANLAIKQITNFSPSYPASNVCCITGSIISY